MSINNVQASSDILRFSNCEQGEKTFTASIADVILNANSNRKYAAFVNNSSVDITLVLAERSKAVINKGIILKPRGGSYEINQNNLYSGAISAICANNCKLSYVECD